MLDFLAEYGIPIETQTPSEAREANRKFLDYMGPGPEVGSVTDTTIPGPGGDLPLRIYAPMADGPHPVLVYFHGGGFVIGDLETHDALCREITKAAGIAVVSVDYRLAPEHKWPAAVDDCWGAVQWIAANGVDLYLDASRLAVGGDSAGGALAAVVAQRARDAGGPDLSLQVLIYPGTDIGGRHPSIEAYGEGMLLTKAAIEWFGEQYVPAGVSAEQPEIAPLWADSMEDLAPALVITAEYDPLVDEGEAYAQRLADAGVSTTLTRYPGMIHAFVQLGSVVDAAGAAIEEIAAALQEAFG